MSFLLRAAIALLAGIGAGLIGFWIVWSAVWKVVGERPGIGHDSWLLAGIFVPGGCRFGSRFPWCQSRGCNQTGLSDSSVTRSRIVGFSAGSYLLTHPGYAV